MTEKIDKEIVHPAVEALKDTCSELGKLRGVAIFVMAALKTRKDDVFCLALARELEDALNDRKPARDDFKRSFR